MKNASNAIAQFWSLFQSSKDRLAAIKTAGPSVPAYDALLAQLQKIDAGLYIEFSAEPGNCNLIITAQRNRTLFPLVNSIVAAAPEIKGWNILALKPKLGFPAVAEWEDFRIAIADVSFLLLERKGSDSLGLRVLIPGIGPSEIKAAFNAIMTAIDQGLGEKPFAEAVQYIEIHPLPEDASKDEYLPLTQLEKYVTLWEQKRKKKTNRKGKKGRT